MPNKTIGILGGMGSWATLNFFRQILELSEPDEFRIIIDNNVTIPSRTRAVKEGGLSPKSAIKRALADIISQGSDFTVIPCNSAHYWWDENIEEIIFLQGAWYKEKLNWLNMIEVVSDAVKAQGYSRPLILGGYVTVEKRLYSKYLPGAVYLDESGNSKVYEDIALLKNNKHPRPNSEIWHHDDSINLLDDEYIDLDVDCILLACTELSLLRKDMRVLTVPIIDSSLEYARATVKYAREE